MHNIIYYWAHFLQGKGETRVSSSYISICLMSLNLFDCSRSSQRHPSYLRLNSQPFLILTNRVRQDLERKSLPRVGSSEPSAPVWAVILIGPTSVCKQLCNRKTIRSGLQRHRAEVTELCVLNEQRGRARDTQVNRETKAAHTWQRVVGHSGEDIISTWGREEEEC